jgi:hypothetical protein
LSRKADHVTIRCLYSCDGCGLSRVSCDVPARSEEDVLAWMEQTIRVLSRDHARRSPTCHPRSLQEVMIPIEGAEKVGGPSVQ